MRLLLDWKHEQAQMFTPSVILPTAFLFSSDTNPYVPIFPTYITKKVKRFIKQHDLPDMSPHDLRHTCGSLMSESGVSIKTIQQFLGHEDVKTTLKFYIGTDDNEMRKATDILENSLSG